MHRALAGLLIFALLIPLSPAWATPGCQHGCCSSKRKCCSRNRQSSARQETGEMTCGHHAKSSRSDSSMTCGCGGGELKATMAPLSKMILSAFAVCHALASGAADGVPRSLHFAAGFPTLPFHPPDYSRIS